ncbi:hypothetical protein C2S52_006503 [Perilla frutescens var. hirtella]|nr:hypothetical protein C2S52_006503 [Perilla frutescens var. hirtella]
MAENEYSILDKTTVVVEQLKLPYFPDITYEDPKDLLCLTKEDEVPMEIGWGYCLAGICLGRFPGVKAVEDLANSWPSKPRVSCYSNRRTMMEIHGKGPYSIYKRPITLHLLTHNFSFEKLLREDIQIWVNVHNIPMEFWNAKALGKIASRVGTPIMIDTSTYMKRKLDYARVFVAINPSTEPPMQLEILSLDGFGHYKATCQGEKETTLVGDEQRRVKEGNSREYKAPDPIFHMRQKLIKELGSAKCKGIFMPYSITELNRLTVEEGEKLLATPFIKRLLELKTASKDIPDDLKRMLKAKGIDEKQQSSWVEVSKFKSKHLNNEGDQHDGKRNRELMQQKVVEKELQMQVVEGVHKDANRDTCLEDHEDLGDAETLLQLIVAAQSPDQKQMEVNILSVTPMETVFISKEDKEHQDTTQGKQPLLPSTSLDVESTIGDPETSNFGRKNRRKGGKKTMQDSTVECEIGLDPLLSKGRLRLINDHPVMEYPRAQPVLEAKGNWGVANNFDVVRGGRILTLWNPITTELEVINKNEQVIHCRIKCKVTKSLFYASFIYGYWSVPTRRPLWNSFHIPDLAANLPWLIMAFSFTDVESTGATYTWANNKGVRSKLDRAMMNSTWLENGGLCKANFLPNGMHLDHSPIEVTLFGEQRTAPKPFKFHNMWIRHPKFLQLIEEEWIDRAYGTEQYRLAKKLKELQKHLKQLNKDKFEGITNKAKESKRELEEHQIQLDADPLNVELREKIPSLRKKALFQAEAERQFFSQRAKCKHLLESDRNTKFFYAIVKKNNTKHGINMLVRENGQIVEELDQISYDFMEFYTKLFGEENLTNPIDEDVLESGPRILEEDKRILMDEVTVKKIKDAPFDIGDEKAPGLDGFSSALFKTTWATTGPGLCAAVREFFRSGRLLKQTNHTIVSLIPKVSHNPKVGDFRRIACCNVVYKLITNILSSKLAKVMDRLVSHAQSAFVEGRNITDNIFLAQELIRKYFRTRNAPNCTLKIDLRKAYDTISWNFLREVLIGLGIPLTVVGWILECVTTATYSLSINGGLHRFIKGKRGLRQGDPMSPQLFLLCMEYFSRLVELRTKDSDFNYHTRCKKLKITHLAFADDLMLFTRGYYRSVQIMMDTLKEFEHASGL